MGYRGEDASRTRAASRRQRARQSSSDPRGYGQEDAYAPAGETGGHDAYGQDDSYAGYDAYDQHAGYDQEPGHDGYGHDGFDHDEYADGRGYGQDDGYGGGHAYSQDDGYGQDDSYGDRHGYGQDDGYGYPQSGYAGSGGQPAAPGGYGGSGGYPSPADGYGGSGGYPAQPGGYGRSGGQPALPGSHDSSGGYPAQPDGYGGSGGYPAQGYGGSGGYPAQGDGYGGSGGYPAQGDGYDGSGAYPAQRGGYGQSGGQPALPGRHDTSGGYPVQEGGTDQEDVPGRYAGNDWYGRPGGASGSGFADTGTFNLDARAIESYAAGLRSPAQDADAPHGLPHTGQQERYDDQYEPYPGYESEGEYEDARGYHAPQGYDQGFDQGHDQGHDQGYDERDDYADPYEDRYGDDDAAPRPPGKDGKPGKRTGGARGGKRRLVLAALAVVLVGIAAAAVYVFALKPKPAADSATSTGPLPSPGTTSAATAACVKQLGEYCHIELRTDDPKPLTLDELYPPAFTNETDHGSFTRIGTKLDTTCSNAVIGQDLVTALQNGKCNQVLRASYVSGDNTIMGTIGVANLSTTNEAHEAGRLVGTNDFVTPLSTMTGVGKKLGQGTGVVEAEYKGHYLIMVWVEFTNTSAPANNTQDQELQQFGTDLIAGTANIDLSQRMVSGDQATAAG